MAKVRVYELAKELGVESKVVMAKLQDLGEFVRSASSTVEAPVVRKLIDSSAEGGGKSSGRSAAPVRARPEGRAARRARPSGGPDAMAPSAPAGRCRARPRGPAAPAAPAPAPAARPRPRPRPRPAGRRSPQPPLLSAAPAAPAPAPRPGPGPGHAGSGRSGRPPPALGIRRPGPPAAPQGPRPRRCAPRPPAPAAPGSASRTARAASGRRCPGSRPRPGGRRARPGRRRARPARVPATTRSPPARPACRARAPRPAVATRRDRADRGEGRPDSRPPRPGRPRAQRSGARRVPACRRGRPLRAAARPGGARRSPSEPGHDAPPSGPGDRGGVPAARAARRRPRRRPAAAPAVPAARAVPALPAVPVRPAARRVPAAVPGPVRPRASARVRRRRRTRRRRSRRRWRRLRRSSRRRRRRGPRWPRRGTQGAFGRPGGRGPARGRKSKKQRRQEFDNMQAPSLGGVMLPRGNGQVVRLPRGCVADPTSPRRSAPTRRPGAGVLFHLGEMVTATQSVDEETCSCSAPRSASRSRSSRPRRRTASCSSPSTSTSARTRASDEDLVARPPVVTVMGHVDHGKTRLLDAIRKANVVAGEAGGITQHIGAYQVIDRGRAATSARITFIDTPGHEAFTAMRARGAQVTDIAILVVAADDGVMPQTIEALNHAKAADVPIVVAVNKIDKEGANPAKVRSSSPSTAWWPRSTAATRCSSTSPPAAASASTSCSRRSCSPPTPALDLRANPNKDARGVAIEAHLDKGRGAVATVLVQRGTLRVGDSIVVGDALRPGPRDARRERRHRRRGRPVPPGAGAGSDHRARAPATPSSSSRRTARPARSPRSARPRERNAQLAKARKRISLEDFTSALEAGKVEHAQPHHQGRRVRCRSRRWRSRCSRSTSATRSTCGSSTAASVRSPSRTSNLATVDDAIIIGFNVRAGRRRPRERADREGVDVRYYSVIYQAIEEIEAAAQGHAQAGVRGGRSSGTAEIREVFRSSKFGNIAGVLVRSGHDHAATPRPGSSATAWWSAENLTIESLRRFKDDVTEVREGFECGIGLGKFNDIQVGRRDRDVRDAREAARLSHAPTGCP